MNTGSVSLFSYTLILEPKPSAPCWECHAASQCKNAAMHQSQHPQQPLISKDLTMPSHIDYPVVVITGASSGIGRATAHAFAKQGAAVVLAARRMDRLREVERECLDLGGDALAV